MAAVYAPELPAEVAYASDSADDLDFWEELGKPSSQGETCSTSRRVMVRLPRSSLLSNTCMGHQGHSRKARGLRITMMTLSPP